MANNPAQTGDPQPASTAGLAQPAKSGEPPAAGGGESAGDPPAHLLRVRLADVGARAALEVEDVLIGLSKFPSP